MPRPDRVRRPGGRGDGAATGGRTSVDRGEPRAMIPRRHTAARAGKGRPSGPLPVAALLLLSAAVAGGPSPATAAAASASAPVHAYDLGVATASVLPSGDVVLRDAGGRTLLLLSARPAHVREVPPGSFQAVFAEGDPHGRRGFDLDADDDGDGRRDEDPANGRDDDGDGRRDEDFAAVSEAMAVVDRPLGAGVRLHLEAYHWSYPHLRRGLALSLAPAGPRAEASAGRITARAAGVWRLADLATGLEPSPGAPATAAAFVVELGGDRRREDLWLGVSVLAAAPGAELPVARDDRLELPLSGGAELALAIAPTRLQLRRQLASLHCVRFGMPDGRGARVPWTVPPLCRICLAGEAPAASWAAGPRGWRLVVPVRPGVDAMLDPDRLSAAGRSLGPPERIEWRPASEESDPAWSVPWAAPGSDLVADDLLPDLYEGRAALRRHVAAGELVLHFRGEPPWPAEGAELELAGERLSGRPFHVPLAAATRVPDRTAATPEPEVAAPPDRPGDGATAADEADRDPRRPPQLAPELLQNYPNPFTDRTRVGFRVPATIGEAFAPEDAKRLGDPDEPLPLRGGVPLVSLRVYRLDGAEVATLQSGPLAAGRYEAEWDGTDRFGHSVASGTYFCKLQVDGWSVTKRLVFLR